MPACKKTKQKNNKAWSTVHISTKPWWGLLKISLFTLLNLYFTCELCYLSLFLQVCRSSDSSKSSNLQDTESLQAHLLFFSCPWPSASEQAQSLKGSGILKILCIMISKDLFSAVTSVGWYLGVFLLIMQTTHEGKDGKVNASEILMNDCVCYKHEHIIR